MAASGTVWVVGSGPNGLAAAITLARRGVPVRILEAAATPGGGCRTQPMPGYAHLRRDPCAAVHPLAAASPFFRARPAAFAPPLEHAPYPLGHAICAPAAPHSPPAPLSTVVPRQLPHVLHPLLGDGPSPFPGAQRWYAALEPVAQHAPALIDLLLGAPASPPTAAPALAAAAVAAARLQWEMRTRSTGWPATLFAGLAAHSIAPPTSPVATGAGLLLTAALHSTGWPIPRGGSGVLTAALIAELASYGVEVECSSPVDSLDQLGRADTPVFLAVGAREAGRILAASARPGARRASRLLAAMPLGGAAARVDFALTGPVPWRNRHLGDAGTVHLTGTTRDIQCAERLVGQGKGGAADVILLSQPWAADRSRIVAQAHGPDRVLWTYAHVPRGFTGSVSAAIASAIEVHAPGFRDVVAGTFEAGPVALARYNRSYTGGDIASGAATMAGMAHRAAGPGGLWRMPGGNVVVCSASTLPGPGVHGMGGALAAERFMARRG